MEIHQQETDTRGAFYIQKEGKKLAELTYSKAGSDRIILDHTEVDDTMRGEGVGNDLVEKAVTYAREKGLKIIPLCPFAKSVFDKNPELKDVL